MNDVGEVVRGKFLGQVETSRVQAFTDRKVSRRFRPHDSLGVRRTVLVILDHPPVSCLAHLSQIYEQVQAEHFLAIGSVESFDVSVLVWLPLYLSRFGGGCSTGLWQE